MLVGKVTETRHTDADCLKRREDDSWAVAFLCSQSQYGGLIIKLAAESFQEKVMPDHKVFDRSLGFLLGDWDVLYSVQLVCVSVMKNS